MSEPLLLQSMYLCKAALSGGEVGSHQDATFLWTDPVTVTGHLGRARGRDRRQRLPVGAARRAPRRPAGEALPPAGRRRRRDGVRDRWSTDVEVPEDGWVPLEATAGTVVAAARAAAAPQQPQHQPAVAGGVQPAPRRGGARYPADNWLQRPADLPARGFCSGSHRRPQIRPAPKVLLHDHLDGGLRPRTVVELAAEQGYDALPTTDVEALGRWFRDSADAGSLPRYLETFAHTVGVMQTREALVRVARECAEDLAADGVVYAEVRFAPELHLEGDLTLPEVVEAVQEGYRQGCEGRPIRVVSLLTAMRHAARSLEIAELAVRYRHRGVVGFDIAGAEAGFPPIAPPRRRSSTCSGPTGTSRSTPARRSGCRASGRRCRSATPTGSATACASWTTSRSTPTASRRSGRWRSTSATAASRWSCARRRTCRPAPRRRSPSTRSGCCASCSSGSPSTPTTG